MLEITVDKRSQLNVKESLMLMMLPRSKRKRILAKTTKASIKLSRKNQRQQKGPDGKKWKKRKTKGGRKMMSGLARYMTTTSNDGQSATIGWRSGKTAEVAFNHHHGKREKRSRAAAIKAQRD